MANIKSFFILQTSLFCYAKHQVPFAMTNINPFCYDKNKVLFPMPNITSFSYGKHQVPFHVVNINTIRGDTFSTNQTQHLHCLFVWWGLHCWRHGCVPPEPDVVFCWPPLVWLWVSHFPCPLLALRTLGCLCKYITIHNHHKNYLQFITPTNLLITFCAYI